MATARDALAIGVGGGLASVFARLLVYPVDVMRTVYVTKGRRGVRALGLIDLYRGLYPAMIDAFAYHAANFGIYELLKGVYFRFVSRAASIGAPLPPLVRLPLPLVLPLPLPLPLPLALILTLALYRWGWGWA